MTTFNRVNASAASLFPKTEEGWKAEWTATPKLQEEYPTPESYAASMKREAYDAARYGRA